MTPVLTAPASKLLRLVASESILIARIDAREFADEIVELLKAGYMRLGGTLQEATLELTDAGRLHAKDGPT